MVVQYISLLYSEFILFNYNCIHFYESIILLFALSVIQLIGYKKIHNRLFKYTTIISITSYKIVTLKINGFMFCRKRLNSQSMYIISTVSGSKFQFV